MHRAASMSLLVGLIISMIVHATALIPGLVTLMSQGSTKQPSPQLNEGEVKLAPPEEEVIELGIERSLASTMTWVGHAEYQEHMAALSEVEQAAFTDTAGADAQFAVAAPTPVTRMSETPAEQRNEPAETPEPEQKPKPEPVQPPQVASTELWTQIMSQAAAAFAAAQRQIESPTGRQPPKPPSKKSPAEPQQTPRPQKPIPVKQPASPTPEGTPGEMAEKQSAATSTFEVPLDQIKPGQPLAAEGLELLPQRPKLTNVIMLTASPCNPLAELTFDRSGKPTKVVFVQDACDSRVNDAVKASLYRWRAKGEQLEQLGEQDTFALRIKLVLNPRAR